MEAAVAATPTGLCIRGRVDFLNAEQLCAEGSRLLNGHVEPISVDLEQADHAGSVVIAMLIVWARASQQTLHLVSVPKSMRRVLEFTGMDELFVLPELSALEVSDAALSNLELSGPVAVRSASGGLLKDAVAPIIGDVGKESNV